MRPRTIAVVIMLLATVFIGLFVLHQENPALYAQLSSLSFFQQPERFTELYFENASGLPRAIAVSQPVSFAFVIHNMEAATTTYPYEVYFESSQGERTNIATGTVTLGNNASAVISVPHTVPAPNFSGKVVVNLPSLGNQRIDFLLPNNN